MKGESHWSQRNKTVHLTPGDFVIASMAEPYSLQLFDDFEMPVLALTSRTMHTLTRDPDQFLGVRMAAEEADCGLLSSFVSQVVARISRLKEPMIRVREYKRKPQPHAQRRVQTLGGNNPPVSLGYPAALNCCAFAAKYERTHAMR